MLLLILASAAFIVCVRKILDWFYMKEEKKIEKKKFKAMNTTTKIPFSSTRILLP